MADYPLRILVLMSLFLPTDRKPSVGSHLLMQLKPLLYVNVKYEIKLIWDHLFLFLLTLIDKRTAERTAIKKPKKAPWKKARSSQKGRKPQVKPQPQTTWQNSEDPLSAALVACLSVANAFTVSRHASTSDSVCRGTTRLYQRTLGFETPGYSRAEMELQKKQTEVIGYLSGVYSGKEATALRPNVGPSVLISGFDPEQPASVEILDFLNNEYSPHLSFTKIVAHVEDMKTAKKRLIGRNARYTGLLDKLDFSEGTALPTAAQLDGMSSWVVHVDGGDMSKLSDIADLAASAESVQNVAILISGAQGVGAAALQAADEMLQSKASSFAYTLLVGESFSREESLRIITECLAIDKAAGKSVVANAAKDVTSLEHMMIQGMREIGFTRIEEVEQMVSIGVKGYTDMLDEQAAEAVWEKAPEPTEEELAARAQTKEQTLLLQKQKREEEKKSSDISAMALEWAKKEYLRKSLKRRIPMKEPQFIELIWDRALMEADMKWRTMQGLVVNETEERRKFKEEQQRLNAEALKAEQERWAGMDYNEVARR
ncbi:hypothetical protein THAOC_10188 [Thalassiosira oceanica]|uniref:Uncharacterized protein n=1 Tax=Thalassiosira oceanica TaxID=159749 RepID=K0SQQ4_THAOC|nr:hypothetical protein THAOC_10188 [Thalassiosira oceanica]|eukprot:EJK68613.1 hypothetical protein THAOC_10188 [Thalassiosira oceanica]